MTANGRKAPFFGRVPTLIWRMHRDPANLSLTMTNPQTDSELSVDVAFNFTLLQEALRPGARPTSTTLVSHVLHTPCR